VADLTPRIEKLVGRLVRGRGGGATPPAGGPPPALRPGDPGFAEAVARLVTMPLDQFELEGAPLEIRVPWCRETLWFVPDEQDAEVLGTDGVNRGHVWTAGELATMAMSGSMRHGIRTLAPAKVAMGGDVVEVRST